MDLLGIYERFNKVPVVGRRAFSVAAASKAPYFLSISPTVLEIRPNFAQVRVPKWWGVQNHLGTVHVIAVVNGLEMAMGMLAEATIPPHLRWIPKGMNVEYTGMANSKLTATAETDPADWLEPGEVPVRVQATREDGKVVVQGVIRLYTSLKPQK